MRRKKLLYLKCILGGLATYIPGLHSLVSRGTGGTDSARYCYSVWLRHLIMAQNNGLLTCPEAVAELGPGDSLGIGLAALVSGVNRYYAFDVVHYAKLEKNMEILDRLIDLFSAKADIPDDTEFPNLKPVLESYLFPHHILNDERLRIALKAERVADIRRSLLNPQHIRKSSIEVSYFAPWYEPDVIQHESIDMIYSQAVLEHIDDLNLTYESLHQWLKPGGFMSHIIDFKSHGFADQWNGHLSYSDISWSLMKGARPYLLNREPVSIHEQLMRNRGFEIICDERYYDKSGIKWKDLAPSMKYMTDEDLITSEVFIQAIK